MSKWRNYWGIFFACVCLIFSGCTKKSAPAPAEGGATEEQATQNESATVAGKESSATVEEKDADADDDKQKDKPNKEAVEKESASEEPNKAEDAGKAAVGE